MATEETSKVLNLFVCSENLFWRGLFWGVEIKAFFIRGVETPASLGPAGGFPGPDWLKALPALKALSQGGKIQLCPSAYTQWSR